MVWLRNILKYAVELEVVLKSGVVVPVYKGGGKDPLKVDSYRGVTHVCHHQSTGVLGFREVTFASRGDRNPTRQPVSISEGVLR